MAYTYKGTKITGTSKSAKVFSKSGVASASAGQTYLNTEKGHVYRCTSGGKASSAKWEYVRTDVVGKPSTGVSGLKLARRGKGSRVLDATWKVPSALTSATNGRRATGLYITWTFDTDAAGKRNIIDKEHTGNEKAASDAENLASFTCDQNKRKYTRESFYPHAGKPKLISVTVTVNPNNGKGRGGKGVAKSATYELRVPRAPAIRDVAFDTETGTVSAKVVTDAGEDAYERLWTEYYVEVTDTSRAANRTWSHVKPTNTSSTETALSYNVANYQELSSGQYVQVRFAARSRGFRGDSAWTVRDYYVGFPWPAVIPTREDRRVTASSRDSSGKVTVPVDVVRSTQFPVDRVKLQKLVNSEYSNPDRIPGTADWQDAGAIDDGACTALVASVQDLMPDPGKHTWVRVKAWHASEDALFSYSNVVEVPLFEPLPSAEDNECAVWADPGADGTSADVTVAWDAEGYEGDEDTTGVEVSWAEDGGAWRSTDQPDTFELPASWADPSPDARAAGWLSTATVSVRGLSEGRSYYVRARCYTDVEDARSYGPYSDPCVVRTASTPPSAVLSADPVAVPGSGLALRWTLSSAAPQSAWAVLADGDGGELVLMEGEGAAGGCVLPADRVLAGASSGALTCRVRCTAGGGAVESGPVTVLVAERPEARAFAPGLAAQPMRFSVESAGSPSLALSYVVRAAGSGSPSSTAAGTSELVPGDTVATGSAEPPFSLVAWESTGTYAELAAERDAAAADAGAARESGDAEGLAAAEAALSAAEAALAAGGPMWRAEVELPTGLAFEDGRSFELDVSATDTATGLSCACPTATFDVDWAHKAPAPSPDVEVAASVSEDEEGAVSRTATITLPAPEGAGDGDVYDVYRVTHDGPVLIGSGRSFGSEVVDAYAPFGDAADYAYRVACRTPDGDEQWDDYGYFLEGGVLRFDFGSRSVELPYDVGVGDTYEKDFEARRHLDGAVEGFWNDGARRTAKLSTTIVRVEDADLAAAVREMARFAGPVFVRTPDGSAYAANVDVGALDVDGGVLDASFDAEEVAQGAAFMLPAPPEPEGGE